MKPLALTGILLLVTLTGCEHNLRLDVAGRFEHHHNDPGRLARITFEKLRCDHKEDLDDMSKWTKVGKVVLTAQASQGSDVALDIVEGDWSISYAPAKHYAVAFSMTDFMSGPSHVQAGISWKLSRSNHWTGEPEIPYKGEPKSFTVGDTKEDYARFLVSQIER